MDFESSRRRNVSWVIFFTFLSIGVWLVPILMPYWHVKRWFVGLGLVGQMTMRMSLTGYELDLGCDRYNFDWLKNMCRKLEPMSGWHSFSELHDQVCNLEEQTFRVAFRSCHDVQILTWSSMATCFVLAFTLLLLLLGAMFLWLYFNGHANPTLYASSRILYVTAPCLQFCALAAYAGLTGISADFFDIAALPDNPVTPNSPQTVTLHASFWVALFALFAASMPFFMSWYALERDPYLEQRAGYQLDDLDEQALLFGDEKYAEYPQGQQGPYGQQQYPYA